MLKSALSATISKLIHFILIKVTFSICSYEIMRHCWEADPKSRPLFDALVEQPGSLMEFLKRQKYVNMNVPFEKLNAAKSTATQGDYLNDNFAPASKRV